MRDKLRDGELDVPAVVPAPTYTQIPNVLIGLMPEMGDAEFRVAIAIARETFGWHRIEKSLSLTRLCGLTGLSRQGVLNGIEGGLKRHVIDRRPHGNSFEYRLLVKELDQSRRLTGHPTGLNQSTGLTALVDEVDQSVVHEVDTANKDENKRSKIREKKGEAASAAGTGRYDSRRLHPAVQAVRKILGQYPNKMTWDAIIELLGDSIDAALLESCAREWSKRTSNMHNLVWLFEWYLDGGPPQPFRRQPGDRNAGGRGVFVE